MEQLSIEKKEMLLNRMGLNVSDVMLLAGCSRSKAYVIMQTCRTEFKGQAGLLTNMITPRSLCKALGTDIEDELHRIAVAKGQIV